jgi:parallel beta-helix repeat protein
MHDRVSRCFLPLTLFLFLLALGTNVPPVTGLEGIVAPVVFEPENQRMLLAGTPHGSIAIDGDASFSDTALLEGWPGDGSPENPFIIDGLEIDLGDSDDHCISISNTRASFTISNCSFTGAMWEWPSRAGIFLENVMYGELVKNTLNDNGGGISIENCDNCTVTGNTCNNNTEGISLEGSHFISVTNNTCFGNKQYGIYLLESDSNTVVDNACFSNTDHGIHLIGSDSNTLANNITGLDPAILLLIGFVIGLVGITLLGAGLGTVSVRGGPDDIIIPIRYRLVSWLRYRRALRHVDVDKTSETDS